MLKVTTLRRNGYPMYFATWDQFYQWLSTNHHLSKGNFHGSASSRSNPEQTLFTFTTWGLNLTVKVI